MQQLLTTMSHKAQTRLPREILRSGLLWKYLLHQEAGKEIQLLSAAAVNGFNLHNSHVGAAMAFRGLRTTGN